MPLEHTESPLATVRRTNFMEVLVAIGNDEEKTSEAFAYPAINRIEISYGLVGIWPYHYEIEDRHGATRTIVKPHTTRATIDAEEKPFSVGSRITITCPDYFSTAVPWGYANFIATSFYVQGYEPRETGGGILIGSPTSTAPVVENNGIFILKPPLSWPWPDFITRRAI